MKSTVTLEVKVEFTHDEPLTLKELGDRAKGIIEVFPRRIMAWSDNYNPVEYGVISSEPKEFLCKQK